MSKEMSSHEYARFLLAKEDKPLYLKYYYEEMGESCYGYSSLTGVSEDIVESCYVITSKDSSIEINDTYYEIGDVISTIEETDINLKLQDMLYMCFYKHPIYCGNEHGVLSGLTAGFYPDPDDDELELNGFKYINKSFKIAITRGFHPEWKNITLDEVKIWYQDNFKEEVESYL